MNSEIEYLLRTAGWVPGRRALDQVRRARRVLESEGGFALHEAAERELLQFGGLVIGSPGAGMDRARSMIAFEPIRAAGEEERILRRFAELTDEAAFPLAEVDDGQAFLVMGRSGRVFLVMDSVFASWPSLEEALETLLLGRRGTSSGVTR